MNWLELRIGCWVGLGLVNVVRVWRQVLGRGSGFAILLSRRPSGRRCPHVQLAIGLLFTLHVLVIMNSMNFTCLSAWAERSGEERFALETSRPAR